MVLNISWFDEELNAGFWIGVFLMKCTECGIVASPELAGLSLEALIQIRNRAPPVRVLNRARNSSLVLGIQLFVNRKFLSS